MIKSRQSLGKYRVVRRLNDSGFASVFEAVDRVEGRSVALKVPHPQFVDAQLLGDFRKEARITSGLDHPNILPLKNAQFIDGHFTIVSPLGKETLGDRMTRRMTDALRADLCEQLLEAVSYAHRQGVIHCDLKPDNLILFPGNRLRLCDFGISKLAARQTAKASGSGTLGYMAPEQAFGKPCFRSDVFATGLIFYELFTGSLPEWPYRWPPAGIGRLRGRVHPDFVALLRRAMWVDQSKRFRDASQMLGAFLRLKSRGRILSAGRARRRRRTSSASESSSRWREIQHRLVLRQFRSALSLVDRCNRCGGPTSEAMLHCPWCAVKRSSYRGPTRHTERCPRCKRGRRSDWRFCPYCYGPGFKRVIERSYADTAYTGRCANSACSKGVVAPFMRYCPWCRHKVRQRWKLEAVKTRCSGCAWPVLPEHWMACPWCARKLGKPR